MIQDGIETVTGAVGDGAAAAGQVVGAVVGGDVGEAIEDIGQAADDMITQGGEVAGAVAGAVIEETPDIIKAIYNGRKCWVAIGKGARWGALAGPYGAIAGGAAGALIHMDDCIDAVKYGKNAVDEVLDTARAKLEDISCPAGSYAIKDPDVSCCRLVHVDQPGEGGNVFMP